MTTGRQKREDDGVIVKYIKDELFAKVKFFYDEKEDLDVDGLIYGDYKGK